MSSSSTLAAPAPPVVSPFDAMAADYDTAFTHTPVGRLMRAAVWRRMDARFAPGDRILELNCGTGEDAVYLAQRGIQVVATDVSAAMTLAAQAKAERAGVAANVRAQTLAIEQIAAGTNAFARLPAVFSPPFDGVLSNFGGLNCVADLPGVARGLADCIRPGGSALLCVMGPCCAWEWGWYLARGRPGTAFRRWKRGGVVWRGLTIRYPSIGTVQRAFAPHFRAHRVSAVGALLPPTYANDWAQRHPRLLACLNAVERRRETSPLLTAFADHFLIELQRAEDEPLGF